jgi:hypothetical protein
MPGQKGFRRNLPRCHKSRRKYDEKYGGGFRRSLRDGNDSYSPPATPWLATFRSRFATKHPSQRADMPSLMPFIAEPRKKGFYEVVSSFKDSDFRRTSDAVIFKY